MPHIFRRPLLLVIVLLLGSLVVLPVEAQSSGLKRRAAEIKQASVQDKTGAHFRRVIISRKCRLSSLFFCIALFGVPSKNHLLRLGKTQKPKPLRTTVSLSSSSRQPRKALDDVEKMDSGKERGRDFTRPCLGGEMTYRATRIAGKLKRSDR